MRVRQRYRGRFADPSTQQSCSTPVNIGSYALLDFHAKRPRHEVAEEDESEQSQPHDARQQHGVIRPAPRPVVVPARSGAATQDLSPAQNEVREIGRSERCSDRVALNHDAGMAPSSCAAAAYLLRWSMGSPRRHTARARGLTCRAPIPVPHIGVAAGLGDRLHLRMRRVLAALPDGATAGRVKATNRWSATERPPGSADCPVRLRKASAIVDAEQRARDRRFGAGTVGQPGLANRRVFHRQILSTSHPVNAAPMTIASTDQVARASTSKISTRVRCRRFWRHRISSVNQSRSTSSPYGERATTFARSGDRILVRLGAGLRCREGHRIPACPR